MYWITASRNILHAHAELKLKSKQKQQQQQPEPQQIKIIDAQNDAFTHEHSEASATNDLFKVSNSK